MGENKLLKELVDKLCVTLDDYATRVGLPGGTGDLTRFSIAEFMMYLSASDGTISWDEAKTITDICELPASPEAVGAFVRDKNIYSVEFENSVPITFQAVVDAEKKMRAQGINIPISDSMLDAYKLVGEALIESDGNVTVNERTDYNIYIKMLEAYRDNNLTGEGEVSGFSKNTGSVSAPSKSGVSAPKKG